MFTPNILGEKGDFMSSNQARAQAIAHITNHASRTYVPTEPLKDIWASDVFNLATMEEALSKNVFKAMKNTVMTGAALDPAAAEVVAAAMKEWAMAKGAKFFSHIFYPMTNITAEKHDGFIITNPEGGAITEFTASLLIKGEPDGSSFPNGSLRMTNAARGYTAWDPTSPAFVMTTANGAVLMIPSVFVSWTGEALDKKIPLLRSNAAVNKAAQKVLALMGETEIGTVNSSCGAEQEYFLIDENFANARPDLLMCAALCSAPRRPRASNSTTTISAPSRPASRSSCRTSRTSSIASASRPRPTTTRSRPASSNWRPISKPPMSPPTISS